MPGLPGSSVQCTRRGLFQSNSSFPIDSLRRRASSGAPTGGSRSSACNSPPRARRLSRGRRPVDHCDYPPLSQADPPPSATLISSSPSQTAPTRRALPARGIRPRSKRYRRNRKCRTACYRSFHTSFWLLSSSAFTRRMNLNLIGHNLDPVPWYGVKPTAVLVRARRLHTLRLLHTQRHW